MNGFSLEYGNEIRSLLKRLATDESTVPVEDVIEYLDSNTAELPPEKARTYQKFLDRATRRTIRRNDYTGEEGI